MTDYLVFLSDDLTHDAHMVETILANAKGYLRKEAGIEKFFVRSDGCAAQYKSKLPSFTCPHLLTSNGHTLAHAMGRAHVIPVAEL